MLAKDRLTLVLCVNATGTCKIDPLLVGSAMNPHCFRDERSPIPYTSKKNAWVDRKIYREWWSNIFLPAVRLFTHEPFALLMDNCSGHDPSCVDPRGQVEVIYFPPNCTSVYQPLDQGIITTLKTLYKKEMLTSFATAYERFEELQVRAKKLTITNVNFEIVLVFTFCVRRQNRAGKAFNLAIRQMFLMLAEL